LERDRLDHPAPFATIIRRVTDGDQRALPIKGSRSERIHLPFNANRVTFEFSTNRYEVSSDPKFRTRLVGYLQSWSEPSTEATVHFDGLAEGYYLFEVQAVDSDGNLGSVASFPFIVDAPWYRSIPAYIFYVLSSISLVTILVRLQLRRLRKRNRLLAETVAEQTRELREQHQELLSARDVANAASAAKSHFLANMSHELRTPLNAILGYTQLILRDRALPEPNPARLQQIKTSGEHLLGLINEVLDLSKVESGKLGIRLGQIDTEELATEMVNSFRHVAAEKCIEFRFIKQTGVPRTIITDGQKIRQVLLNLLSNAMKFTPSGGKVILRLLNLPEPERVRFVVEDTGIGIASKDLAQLFEPFAQAIPSESATQGTGLGLAISKKLIEILGSQLQVKSELGTGSKFWFDILVQKHAEEEIDRISMPGPAVIGYYGRRRHLLVTDDDCASREFLAKLLEQLGFVIDQAANGLEALDRLKECETKTRGNRYDAILLDLRMPKLGGLETAGRICERYRERRPKILAISASVFGDDQTQALQAGCDGFIS
jgi:signal transduction histidine kinase